MTLPGRALPVRVTRWPGAAEVGVNVPDGVTGCRLAAGTTVARSWQLKALFSPVKSRW